LLLVKLPSGGFGHSNPKIAGRQPGVGNGSIDQTISFASASNELYMATLRAVNTPGSVGGFPPFVPGTLVYNFAVARLRYRALSTMMANVRVFFRMFQASTTSTDFQPTTYAADGLAGTKVPLLGVVNREVVTIPFFAAPCAGPSNPSGLDARTGPDNVGPVGEAIPADGTGNEVQCSRSSRPSGASISVWWRKSIWIHRSRKS
jgi:hypothetical protein